MLRQRLILGPIMVIAAVLVVWLDVLIERQSGRIGVAFGTLIAALITMACWELARILRSNGVLVITPVAVCAGLVGLLGTAFWADEPRALGTLATNVIVRVTLLHVKQYPSRIPQIVIMTGFMSIAAITRMAAGFSDHRERQPTEKEGGRSSRGAPGMDGSHDAAALNHVLSQ